MSQTWTALAVLTWTANRFAARGIGSPRLDAELILAHVLATTRVGLYTGHDRPLEEVELTRARELIKRRLAGEPVAYLVGAKEFWSASFAVDGRVLVPRPDTELLVEAALRRARALPAGIRIADVATGSGVVGLTLARELGGARVVLTDFDAGAVAVASQNRDALGLGERVEIRQGDLAAPLGDDRFHIVTANLPYVRTDELAGLSPEVQHEPRIALDGGPDGLHLVRRFVATIGPFLEPLGWVGLEHGWQQGPAVRALLVGQGFAEVTTRRDLAGHERVTEGHRPD